MDLQYMQMPTVNIEKYPYKHRFLPVVYNKIKIVMMHNQAWRLERLKEKKKKKKDEKNWHIVISETNSGESYEEK